MKLNKTFKVQGIPCLVILDENGKLITKDGREAVSKDPKGEEMPWPLGSFGLVALDDFLVTILSWVEPGPCHNA